MKRATLMTAALAPLLVASGLSSAANLPGSFPGVTIGAKLIGGQQYESLYAARIPEWEKLTGAKVNILSKKNGFDIDKELKEDIAGNTVDWCVGWNHTSFAPQYMSLYTDLSKIVPKEEIDKYVAGIIKASTVNGKLEMLPRAQFDVSALYYLKSNYTDDARKKAFKEKYGYDLAPPTTWQQVTDQAIFFSDPPNFYGTEFAGKEEAINGRFYEMLVADGGEYLDSKGRPAFNSDAGVRALNWFVNLYKAKAVPPGTVNYLWDDLGQGFASGTIALDLDWPSWAKFFNDPKTSKAAGNVGIIVQPVGSADKHTGWSGTHGFSVTEACKNKAAAVSLILWLTDDDSQKIEAANGSLPTRPAVWEWDIAQAANDPYRKQVLATFEDAAKYAFPVPPTAEWIEISNVVYPELQSAILGDKTPKAALDAAAAKATKVLQDAGKL